MRLKGSLLAHCMSQTATLSKRAGVNRWVSIQSLFSPCRQNWIAAAKWINDLISLCACPNSDSTQIGGTARFPGLVAGFDNCGGRI